MNKEKQEPVIARRSYEIKTTLTCPSPYEGEVRRGLKRGYEI